MIGNKSVVYLDQFAISNMVDAKEGDIWYDVKKVIEKYHSDGKIICPMSAEHVLETSQRDFKRAGMQDEFFWEISDGYTFWALPYIIAGQICELIKSKDLDTFYLEYNPNWNLAEEKCYNIVKLLFRDGKNDVNQNFGSFGRSKLNKIVKSKILHFDKHKKALLQEILKQSQLFVFKQKIDFVVENFDYINETIKSSPEQLIEIDLIILCLILCFQFSKQDFCCLRSKLYMFEAKRIKSLDIEFNLCSYLHVNGGKVSMNDIVDYRRIATGLPYSDVLFCDKKYKRYIIELGLNKRYDAKICSGTNEDLKYFLDYLYELYQ
mgnify:CR=1 FL=1